MEYYTSPSRGFDEAVPVHVWTRFVFQADLAKHKAFKRLAVALMIKHARRCGVSLHAVAAMDNHFHAVVSQRGRIRQADKWRRGISPWMRDWKSELSRYLRLLGLAGSKFEGRFGSANLLTLEQYVTKFAYVVGQAVRHGAREEDVVISRAILVGDVDGITETFPALFGEDAREEARCFGALIAEVIAAARALAAGQELEARAGLAAERRRRQRRDLEQRRRSHRRRDLHQRRLREMAPPDWWEAAQVVLWNHGLSEPERRLTWVAAASVAPERWAKAAAGWRAYCLPELLVCHERTPAGRVLRTLVTGAGHAVSIEWPLRLTRPPP